MIVTEEEAKTKACCGGPNCGGRLIPVTSDGVLQPNCIGSDCMAWRWHCDPYGYCSKAGKP